jgi:gluconate 2-dehydrogenase gamma chain
VNTPSYPEGTVRRLLASDSVTAATRAALRGRVAGGERDLRFFDATQAATLRAVVERLFGGVLAAHGIDLLADLDERLAAGDGDGWRYDVLPPDDETYRRLVPALDATAWAMAGATFASLDAKEQDAVLQAVQREVPGGVPTTRRQPRRCAHTAAA